MIESKDMLFIRLLAVDAPEGVAVKIPPVVEQRGFGLETIYEALLDVPVGFAIDALKNFIGNKIAQRNAKIKISEVPEKLTPDEIRFVRKLKKAIESLQDDDDADVD